jgi:hypothetical protein
MKNMYDQIGKVQQELYQHFYKEASLICPSEMPSSLARFFQKFRKIEGKEDLSKLLLFGNGQYSFLEKVVQLFPASSTFEDLFGVTREKSEALLPLIGRIISFRKMYFSVLSGFLPAPFSYYFDPKGVGGNVPGLMFKETISDREVFWSASPQPFLRDDIAPEASSLLASWEKRGASSLWIYCNFQSLCHYWERKRSLSLSSLARIYPSHMKVLHITKDSPLYLKAPLHLSLSELFKLVVQELQKENSLYQTSLTPSLHKEWTQHALHVAESAYDWVKERQIQEESLVFMELFSLGLSRRWVGFSLHHVPAKEVFLMQTCKEGIDRGAVWLFELASFLSPLSMRELQALLWGRALLARGRLPQPYRYRGARALVLSVKKEEAALWLMGQLEEGLGSKLDFWKLLTVGS